MQDLRKIDSGMRDLTEILAGLRDKDPSFPASSMAMQKPAQPSAIRKIRLVTFVRGYSKFTIPPSIHEINLKPSKNNRGNGSHGPGDDVSLPFSAFASCTEGRLE